MKKNSWLFFLIFLAMACQDNQIILQEDESALSRINSTKAKSNARLASAEGVSCGEIKVYPLMANGLEVGSVQVTVDESGMSAYYDLSSSEWFLTEVKAFAGDCNAIPDLANFPYQDTYLFDDEVKTHTFTIPWDNLPECGCIQAAAVVSRYNPIGSVLQSYPASIQTDYCNCEEPETPNLECDDVIVLPISVNGGEEGTVQLGLDKTNIAIDYNLAASEWFLVEVSAAAGTCSETGPTGEVYNATFPTDDEVRTHSFSIPLANLPDCGCIETTVTLARYNSNTSQIETIEKTTKATYCKCDEPNDGNFRTQTPGGWGAPPNGDNPGTYLHEYFDEAFPQGLVVGCTYTITLTSAQAVTNFLPQGGTAGALTKSYVDPVKAPKSTNNPKNVLAGHVVALTLSVKFDALDEGFSENDTDLGDAKVTEGTFEGWTVAEVLAEAKKLLGGCESSYTAEQLTEALTAINESYVDGNFVTGFISAE